MDVISEKGSLVEAVRGLSRALEPDVACNGDLKAEAVRGANVYEFRRPAPLVAYLSDFVAVDGAGLLLVQAALLDASPHARCGIGRRYIDSGRPDGPLRFGHALCELIRDACDKRFRAFLVETVARLAPDLTSALQAAMLIMAEGVEIYEAVAGRVIVEPEVAARIRSGLA